MQTIVATLVLSLLFAQSSGQVKKTDLEYDELNGPVRIVRVEVEDTQYQSGAPRINTRFLEKIVAYDVTGRVTEEMRSFGTDCVSSRHVFRYDPEGSRTEAIYSGKALAARDKSNPSQPPVTPLMHKQVFKVDAAGRRSEIDEYDDKGKLSGKTFYEYDNQARLNDIIQESDSTRSRCEFKYNDKGLASEKTCGSATGIRDRSQYTYEYDAKGNWIKRTAKNSCVLPNRWFFEAGIRIHYREIKYFAGKEDQAQQEEPGDRFDATKLAACPTPIIRKACGAFFASATRHAVPQSARTTGAVVVEVTVDEAGKVIAVQAISGPAELRKASEQAARGWTFHPTLLSGMPVKVIGTLTFNFNL